MLPVVGVTLPNKPTSKNPRGVQNFGQFSSVSSEAIGIVFSANGSLLNLRVHTQYGEFAIDNLPNDETKQTPYSWFTLDLGAISTGGWTTLKKDASQINIGTTYTDVSGLTVPVLTGNIIRFRAYLACQTSATTIAANLAINGPATSAIAYEVIEATNATTGRTFRTCTTFDSITSVTTAGPGATTVLYEIRGFAIFTADGTFSVRAKAETGGTMSVLAGSWMEYII